MTATRGRPVAKVAATPSPAMRALETELTVLFRRSREIFQSAASDVHPELTMSSYATLIRVVEEGPLRASDLVEYFGTDKGSMSRQVAHLERLGLVRRTKDPADGRAQVLRATALAKRRSTRARERSRAAMRARIATWSEPRTASFAALVHDFNLAMARTP